VLDLRTADDVLATVREIFPEEEPPQRLRLLLGGNPETSRETWRHLALGRDG
jgi:hypothetical protein